MLFKIKKNTMFNQKKFYKNNQNRFVVNYPQERLDGELYKYCCVHCKIDTLTIRGKVENHSQNGIINSIMMQTGVIPISVGAGMLLPALSNARERAQNISNE